MTRIYIIHDASDNYSRIYVGKTVKSLQKRLSIHLFHARTQQHFMAKWLRAVQARNGVIEIVEIEQVEGDWAEAERCWIAYFKFIGAALLNLTDGGEGVPGLHPSDITRRKMSLSALAVSDETRAKRSSSAITSLLSIAHREQLATRKLSPEELERRAGAMRGKTHTAETRKKMSVARKGHKLSDETRKRMSEAHKGKRQSAEAVEKTAAAHRGKKRSPETIARMRAAQCLIQIKKRALAQGLH